MALSNTAVPKYYGMFRDAVLRDEIKINKEIAMEMLRIDELIDNKGVYYDDQAVEGFISYCENELTLTDGSDLNLLDSFKLWAEEIFGWYYFVERSVYEPDEDGHGGHYVTKSIKKRLVNKQYLIVARGAAKSMYASFETIAIPRSSSARSKTVSPGFIPNISLAGLGITIWPFSPTFTVLINFPLGAFVSMIYLLKV